MSCSPKLTELLRLCYAFKDRPFLIKILDLKMYFDAFYALASTSQYRLGPKLKRTCVRCLQVLSWSCPVPRPLPGSPWGQSPVSSSPSQRQREPSSRGQGSLASEASSSSSNRSKWKPGSIINSTTPTSPWRLRQVRDKPATSPLAQVPLYGDFTKTFPGRGSFVEVAVMELGLKGN